MIIISRGEPLWGIILILYYRHTVDYSRPMHSAPKVCVIISAMLLPGNLGTQRQPVSGWYRHSVPSYRQEWWCNWGWSSEWVWYQYLCTWQSSFVQPVLSNLKSPHKLKATSCNSCIWGSLRLTWIVLPPPQYCQHPKRLFTNFLPLLSFPDCSPLQRGLGRLE